MSEPKTCCFKCGTKNNLADLNTCKSCRKELYRIYLKELLIEMHRRKTCQMIDSSGCVWALGRWYGDPLHFRCNFGHPSESVLEPFMYERLAPFKPYRPLSETPSPRTESEQWAEFYLKPRPMK